MKCCLCHRAAPNNTLYRVNPKGTAGIWACDVHIEKFPTMQPDEKVLQIVSALSTKQ